MFWTRFPLLRILLAICAGIFLGTSLEVSLAQLSGGIGLIALLWGLLIRLRAYLPRPAYAVLFGILALGVFTGLGWTAQALMEVRQASVSPSWGRWWVEVQDFPEPTENAISAPVRVLGVWQDDSLRPQAGQVMLYLAPDSLARTLRYGDQLVFHGEIQPLPRALNPRQFDFGAYLAEQGFSGTVYLPSGRWTKGERGGMPLWRTLMDLRLHLLRIIQNWPVSEATRAVSQALLLGYRAALEDELRQSFAQAGTMHVLAVSGLHVGILYLVLRYLLFWLYRLPGGRWWQPLIITSLLWGYTVLAGFAPSVVRAVVMFSFVALGRCFNRYTSVYNALLASAILLLLFHPRYLFQVGFQLSYAAVLAIVWVQPMLHRPLITRWKLLNLPLALLTVSITAQIGTAPLALHYFGQFPGLFWLANLWVVPLISLLMYVGLGLMTVSVGVALPETVFLPYEWLMQGMVGGVKWIQGQQWGLISQLNIGWGEVILLYVFFGGLIWWLRWRRQFFWYWALAVLFLVAWQVVETTQQKQRLRVTAYALGYQAGVGVYVGDQGYFLAHRAVLKDSVRLAYQVQPHWNFLDLRKIKRISWSADTAFSGAHISLGPASIAVGRKLIWRQPEPPPPGLAVDCWWVQAGAPPRKALADVEEVWLLSRRAELKPWQEWARKNGVVLRAVHQGAIDRQWAGAGVGREALFAFRWGGE